MEYPSPQPLPDGGADEDGAQLLPRVLIDQLPAILYVAEPGLNGRWLYVSGGVETMLGFTVEEWLADPGLWARQMHPDDRERIFERETGLDAPELPDEYRLRHRDGSIVWVRDEAALLADPQGRRRWHGVMSDISDRKLVETTLERRAEQQAAVARLGEDALEGSGLGDLMRQALRDATRITGSPAGAVMEQDRDSGALIVRAGLGLASPSMATTLARWMEARDGMGGSPPELPDGIIGQIESADGRWGLMWLARPGSGDIGAADGDFVQSIANILADAIGRRASEDAIRYQAAHDHLTGLPNRFLFIERLEAALARSASDVAVVLLDIDNFKLVNDSLGHAAGDELLTQIAPRLKDALRPRDMVARHGGDEFVVLLEEIPDRAAAVQVAERIVAAFEPPFGLDAGEHFAKASIGIAVSGSPGCSPASLVRDADAALYQAKALGRARFEVFDHAMRARAIERLSVENDLRRALERSELRVVYQPVVSLLDGAIRSVEALVRWEHPVRGLIGPSEFIPVAEETGMIEPIGAWVLEVASAQAACWQHADPASRIGVSVNLSARQLMQRDLEASIARTLELTGVDPSLLCLEITETVLLEGAEVVSETIRRTARLGVRFVLDDFGTGYSSLAYVSGLPIDGLKVDRSFVEKLDADERSTAITTAIVRMAQALSLEVIAEGVETREQASSLRILGCELAQGFHFHRPITAEAVTELLGRARAGSARAPGDARRIVIG